MGNVLVKTLVQYVKLKLLIGLLRATNAVGKQNAYHQQFNNEPFLTCYMECRRGLAMRIVSVRMSVRSSVKRVHCDKMEERSVQIFIPYEKSF